MKKQKEQISSRNNNIDNSAEEANNITRNLYIKNVADKLYDLYQDENGQREKQSCETLGGLKFPLSEALKYTPESIVPVVLNCVFNPDIAASCKDIANTVLENLCQLIDQEGAPKLLRDYYESYRGDFTKLIKEEHGSLSILLYKIFKEQIEQDLNTANLSLNKKEEQKEEEVKQEKYNVNQIQQVKDLEETYALMAEFKILDEETMKETEALKSEYLPRDNTVRVVGQICKDVLDRLGIKFALVKDDLFVMQRVINEIMGDQNFVNSGTNITIDQVADLIMTDFDSEGGWH